MVLPGLSPPIFSSPEPKTHGELTELIVYQSIRRLCVCVSVCLQCVLTFSNMNISPNQWADCNQILSEASLGRGKGCNMFLARSDWNSGFHGNG